MSEASSSVARDATPFTAMIFGASGSIGQAMVVEILKHYPNATIYRFARHLERLMPKSALNLTRPGQILDIFWDLNQPEALQDDLLQLDGSSPQLLKIDLIFIASGFLHDANQMPEKTYTNLKTEHLLRSYQLNAIGPILTLQTLLMAMDLKHPCKIGVLSARLGSISDNRMGGWHSYRASKAALNMLLKNLAIELQRKRALITLVGLQPGTTESALSNIFTKNIDPENLQTPAFTAEHLWAVLEQLTPEQSGRLFDFKGESFEP